ncbi:ATP-binding cassette domain-containing protein [Pararhizobium sp. O133]|uniref:ATP-binding cassette domain-containing protein n=1 Tax=Pararhizobium sp. O133 TaxID=3449278 RepID=UPI003F68940A
MMFKLEKVSKRFANGTLGLSDVSLTIGAGEAVGLVGESGSGKTTLIRCCLGLTGISEGRIVYDGLDVTRLARREKQRFRREVQLVFQDPYSSLNPRMTVEELVGEGLLVHGIEPDRTRRRDKTVEMLGMVGLGASDLDRYPGSFSGGQRQRIAIARALITRPKLLVCDEPVAALDVSVQAQVINLLQDLRQDLGLSILFVAHDLPVVRHLCSRISVICQGRIVEAGTSDAVFDAPQSEYTRSLLAAVPIADPVIAQERRAARRMLRRQAEKGKQA